LAEKLVSSPRAQTSGRAQQKSWVRTDFPFYDRCRPATEFLVVIDLYEIGARTRDHFIVRIDLHWNQSASFIVPLQFWFRSPPAEPAMTATHCRLEFSTSCVMARASCGTRTENIRARHQRLFSPDSSHGGKRR